MPLPRARLLVCCTALASAPAFGCNRDECAVGDSRCDGDTAMVCQLVEASAGDVLRWSDQACGPNSCKQVSNGRAFCALSPDPDPRCDGTRDSFCDGTLQIQCQAGYGVSPATDCAATPSTPLCVEISGTARTSSRLVNTLCVAEITPN